MKKIYILLLACLSLQFCGNSSNYDSFSKESFDDIVEKSPSVKKVSYNLDGTENKETENSEVDNAATTNKKIIKNANLKIKVKDVKFCTKSLEKLSDKYSGYITSSNISSYTNSTNTKPVSKDSILMRTGYTISNNMTIRIPTNKLDLFLDEMEKLSVFTDYKNITAKDVTEEFIDITSRLKTKKEVEQRYIQILRTKANTVKDILETEEKLRVIREEIEATEGKLRYLSNKVNFSTINIDMYQDIKYRDEVVLKGEEVNYEKGFFSKIFEGLEGGWNIILYIFIGLSYIWPFLIVGIIVGFIFYRKSKKND